MVGIVAAFGAFGLLVAASSLVTAVLAGVAAAGPALLPGTDLRTAVAVFGIAIIAALVDQEHTVPTFADTLGTGEWAIVALLDLAGVAAVGGIGIGVVTSFGPSDSTVAAAIEVLARLTGRWTLIPRLDGFAVGGTTVTALDVTIVALFAKVRVLLAVTASRGQFAWRAWHLTQPASFRLAIRVATVIGCSVAVITGFFATNPAIATGDLLLARLTWGSTTEAGTLHGAVRAAAVVGCLIAVVADFARLEFAVAALEDRDTGLARGGAIEIGFGSANPVASIAG